MWDKLDVYVAEKTRDEYAARLRRAYHEESLPERAIGALAAVLGRARRAAAAQHNGEAPRPRPALAGRAKGGMIDGLS